ncbi:hypothetical protein B0H11DRAFT_2206881 [Mycena galericulata]|nr:hypothetical protein B0H11DRAFT_2206881 [Mycena galericulata]
MSIDLCATLFQFLDTPKPWDLYDVTSNHISPRKFSSLVPHVAPHLIAEDLEITFNDAVDVLESSNEGVLAANPESSQSPRHRKSAVNLKPAVREKKSAKKIVEKPKNSTSPKKSKQKKAEVKIPA